MIARHQAPRPSDVHKILGAIEAVAQCLEEGNLSTFRDQILTEAADDLLSQANQLLAKKFFVGASVIARCVLENHLKRLCDREKRVPSKSKPMLNDFNQALYEEKPERFYENTTRAWIESLASIGNTAAHEGKATPEDAKKIVDEVSKFQMQFSI